MLLQLGWGGPFPPLFSLSNTSCLVCGGRRNAAIEGGGGDFSPSLSVCPTRQASFVKGAAMKLEKGEGGYFLCPLSLSLSHHQESFCTL